MDKRKRGKLKPTKKKIETEPGVFFIENIGEIWIGDPNPYNKNKDLDPEFDVEEEEEDGEDN